MTESNATGMLSTTDLRMMLAGVDRIDDLRRVPATLAPGLADFCRLVLLEPAARNAARLDCASGATSGAEWQGAIAEVVDGGESVVQPRLLVLPVRERGAVTGALLAVRTDSPRADFSGHETALLESVAASLGFLLECLALRRTLEGQQSGEARLALAADDRARELRLTNENLARSARMKDEFLASMSHELRTPLNAVLGLSEALLDEVFGALDEPQRRALNDVVLSGRHLLALINDILDLSKISAGKMEPECEATDVRDIAEHAVRMVLQAATAKRQRLDLRVGDGVSMRWTDARWLKQILVNLLSNAVKFTPEGGTVRMELSFNPRDVVIVVSDTGIGIKPEEQQRIFEPFVQVRQGLNRPQGGTGLGLALVRALSERLGGRVELQSAPSSGSTFRVTLPITPESLPSVAAAPTLLSVAREEPEASSARRVLLAEDNEANVRTFVSYLQAKGHDVDVARNGELAVAMARAQPYDVVVMDVQMPVMDGLKATQLLRADPAFGRMPIIALTAFAMPGDRERCLAAGADEHLAKPVRLRSLTAMIDQLCTARATQTPQ